MWGVATPLSWGCRIFDKRILYHLAFLLAPEDFSAFYMFSVDDFSSHLVVSCHSANASLRMCAQSISRPRCVWERQEYWERQGWTSMTGFLGWMSHWQGSDCSYQTLSSNSLYITVPNNLHELSRQMNEQKRRIQSCWIDRKSFHWLWICLSSFLIYHPLKEFLLLVIY